MKKILKTILVALVLTLVIAAFAACDYFDKINNSLKHTGGTPTCTEQAICEDCGMPYGETLPHRKGTIPAKAPTCEEEGCSTIIYCLDCGEILTEGVKIEALGHDIVVDEAKAPTCTETGLEEGSHCTRCDDKTVAQAVIPALGHTNGDVVVENDVKPTCENTGSYDNVVYCTVCEAEVSRKTITVDALGHKHGDVVVENNKAPDCENTGSYDNVVYCTVCDKELSRVTVPVDALGHKHGDVVVENSKAPDCVNAGSYDNVVYCTVCDKELSRVTIPVDALGHDLVDVEAKEADCENAGYTAHKTCKKCDYVEGKEEIPALGHEWSDWVITKNPTATTAGEEKRTCANGCEEKRELLFTLYFKPNSNWKQGNARFAAYFFGTKGNTWVSMTDSDGDGVYEVKAPLGYGTVIFCRMNPSATANNWNNKWNQTGDLKIPTDGKNYFTLPNNVWDGATTSWSKLTCVHDTVDGSRTVVKEATCTEAGLATATCKKCGIYEEEIAPLGHKYDSTHKCTVCGAQASFTVAGSGSHLGKEWAPEYTANDMTYDAETGVYTKIYENVAAGSYAFKVARDHSWNTAYPNSDKPYTVATSGSTVIITLKGTIVTVTVEAPAHVHVWSDATCTEPQKCECGETQGDALGHTAGDAATCTTAQICTVCEEELVAALGHRLENWVELKPTCTEAGYTAHQECARCDYTSLYFDIAPLGHDIIVDEAVAPTCTETGLKAGEHCSRCDHKVAQEEVEALGHTDENEDYKCDRCKTLILPEADSVLTIEQALKVAAATGTKYTTQKYYITGTIKNVYNTTYGNMYIVDAEGNELCIYGLYTWDKAVRYDKMEYKPVQGDEITVYTSLGMYNTTKQGKDAWLDEVVAHEHDYKSVVTDPSCLTEGYTTHTCSICKASYVDTKVEALGHTTDAGECERCGATIGGDAPVVGTLAEFTFGANGSAAHVDGNDYGKSKTFTSGKYTLALTGMSKVFGPAYDAKGNSCLKLGTSKVVGKFTFTVPENVTEVVIYVSGYKAATSTNIKINGTSYTVKDASNNGAYTAITIDTTTTKTITFTSVTYRCMINSIVFNGYAQ